MLVYQRVNGFFCVPNCHCHDNNIQEWWKSMEIWEEPKFKYIWNQVFQPWTHARRHRDVGALRVIHVHLDLCETWFMLARRVHYAGWVNFMLLKIRLCKSTIWLFHIAMERSTKFLIGKPSISIRVIYTMAMLVTTRGYICNLPAIILWGSHGWCGPIRQAWSAVGFCAFSRHNIAIE